MLTEDKTITTPEYWKGIYEGKRNDKPTDASNFKRPSNAFDRFTWLANQVEGPRVLDIASGHATTMKRLKAMHPDWTIICSDQTEAAKKAARWEGEYHIIDAYQISNKFEFKSVNTITASQCIEYFEFPDTFMKGARKVADYFVCTIPSGEMKLWSQIKIWDDVMLKAWLSVYGEILHFEQVGDLMLAKIKFNGI